MTGSYFFHQLKTDRYLRSNFAEWIAEQRTEAARRNELEVEPFQIYRHQGRIAALDQLMSLIDQALNLPADEIAENGKS